jgi:hypothetical protein
MADETSIPPAVEATSVDTSAEPKEKKTRAPRKPKAVSEAVADTSVSGPAKKTRGPGKKKLAAGQATVTAPAAAAPAPSKKAETVAKAQPIKRGARKAEAAPVEIDGFSELLKLEQENQKLRQALSEKLRAENADLRKKLGIA